MTKKIFVFGIILLCLINFSFAGTLEDLSTNLVACYPMNETGGTSAINTISGGLNGTYVNTISNYNVTCKVGRCPYFLTTSNNYMNVSGLINPTLSNNNWSVSFWHLSTKSSGNSYPLTFGNSSLIASDTTTNIQVANVPASGRMDVNFVGTLGSTNIQNTGKTYGSWYYITIVMNDTGKASLFIDGEFRGSTSTDNNEYNFILFTFGTNWLSDGTPYQPITGYIDEVKFWNRKLNETEITADYNSGNGINCTAVTSAPSTPALTAVFNEQKPSDLNSGNLFNTLVNISYNISNAPINATSGLFYKANNSKTDLYYCDNATSCYYGYKEKDYNSVSGNTYYWQFMDNEIASGSYLTAFTNYNINHNVTTIGNNDYYRCNFTNIPSVYPQFLELDISATGNIIIGYMNYSSNTKYPFFTNLVTINHSHFNNKSNHGVISIPNNLDLNNTWIYIKKADNNPAYLYNIEASTTSNLCQFSNNGVTWTDTNKILDMHIHWNSTFYYYLNVTDSYSQNIVTSVRPDLFDISGLPPTSPTITGVYNSSEQLNNFTIIKGTSPNNYAVTLINFTIFGRNNNTQYYYNNTANLTAHNNINLSGGNYTAYSVNCDEFNLCNNGVLDFDIIGVSYPETPVTPAINTTTSVNINVTELAEAIKINTGSFELIPLVLIFIVLLIGGIIIRPILISLSGGFLFMISLYFSKRVLEATTQSQGTYYFGLQISLFIIACVFIILGIIIEIMKKFEENEEKDFYGKIRY